MSTYADLRDALFDLIAELDISSVFPEEVEPEDAIWKVMLDRPPKSDELIAFPAFSIQPFRDLPQIADNVTDETGFTFLLRLYVGWHDASDSETMIYELVRIVRQALMNERQQPDALADLCHRVSFTGAWSGDETQGQRIYQLEVTCFVDEHYESLETP